MHLSRRNDTLAMRIHLSFSIVHSHICSFRKINLIYYSKHQMEKVEVPTTFSQKVWETFNSSARLLLLTPITIPTTRPTHAPPLGCIPSTSSHPLRQNKRSCKPTVKSLQIGLNQAFLQSLYITLRT